MGRDMDETGCGSVSLPGRGRFSVTDLGPRRAEVFWRPLFNTSSWRHSDGESIYPPNEGQKTKAETNGETRSRHVSPLPLEGIRFSPERRSGSVR